MAGLGKLFDGEVVSKFIGAKNKNGIAWLRVWDVGDVNDAIVHADMAYDRGGLPSNQ